MNGKEQVLDLGSYMQQLVENVETTHTINCRILMSPQLGKTRFLVTLLCILLAIKLEMRAM